jgi:hypothetical protein
MSDIDFLPASYRQMTVHRKANVWRLAAGGLFVAMIGFSGFYQHMLRRHALADLARTDAAYDRTQALITQQRELKKQLESADCDAQLFAYLRHPWPTTQVLAAALKPLPDCITLREIRLFYAEPTPNATAAGPTKPPDKKTTETLSPDQRDLQQLREQYDGRSRVLILTGTTHDTAALQKYLSALAHCNMFVKSELASLESDAADHAAATRFTARLFLCPGCGQPGGPIAKHRSAPTAAGARKTVRSERNVEGHFGAGEIAVDTSAGIPAFRRDNEARN